MTHPTRLAAVLTAALAAGPAQAFYWDGWPGSSLPAPRSLVPTGDSPKFPPNPTADPKFPPSGEPPGPTPGTPPEVPNPEHVPEPASGVAVLLGLGALAARRRYRRTV